MAGFVEDQGARFGDQGAEALATSRCLGRKKPFENEAVARQTGHGQGRDRCARAGHRRDQDAGFAGRAHESKARIADQRRAGIGDQGDVTALQQILDQACRLLALVVFVQGDGPRPTADAGQQRSTVARVFRRDQRDLAQDFGRPAGKVIEIADRRRNDPEAARLCIHRGLIPCRSTRE